MIVHSGNYFYDRKETYPVEAVLPFIGEVLRDYDGDLMDMSSQRYVVFAHSVECVCCGLRGTYFAKERHTKRVPARHEHYRTRAGKRARRVVEWGFVPVNERYHFNLYAIREDGTEEMLTKDHIIPRSKGGRDCLENYQTMCRTCNCRKGNRLPEGVDEEAIQDHIGQGNGTCCGGSAEEFPRRSICKEEEPAAACTAVAEGHRGLACGINQN